MKIKGVITIILLTFIVASVSYLIVDELGGKGTGGGVEGISIKDDSGGTTSQTVSNGSGGAGRRIIAYYFHGTKRCPTCRKIEAYTELAIETHFAGQLDSGALEYLAVNVDESQNSHFVYDYELTTKSVFIAEYIDGEQTRWKNLDKVWEYVGNQQVFVDYIRDETGDYLGIKADE